MKPHTAKASYRRTVKAITAHVLKNFRAPEDAWYRKWAREKRKLVA